jgi:amidohydrolase
VTRQLSSLRDELSARADDLVSLRRDLHRHPELGFAETRTSAIVAERLEAAGLEVTTEIASTGVVAVLRGNRSGRTIAWRADMDALPLRERVESPFRSVSDGAMHACGHDGHTAIAVVLAEALAAHRDTLSGSLVFVFQPAEEIFAGAQRMIEAGILEHHGIEEIYGLHLVSRAAVGHVETCAGISMAAADVLEIEVHGRGGHGASPDLVINPITVAAQLLVHLQDVLGDAARDRRAVLTMGEIVGGSAFNIVPDLIRMRGSLRTLRGQDRSEIRERLTDYVKRVIDANRARAVIRELGCCPALVNHDTQTALVHRCAAEELGESHAVHGAAVMASDDMALFLAARPGSYMRVGAAPEGAMPPAGHHSPDFAIHEGGLHVGARVAGTVLLTALGREA